MKRPDLKLRYAFGLGDIIACILHSKPIGWFTHFLTGKNEPCQACSQRAFALNVLFPIPVWKIFFKSLEERDDALFEDFKKAGFKIEKPNQNKTQDVSDFSPENIEEKNSFENIEEKKLIVPEIPEIKSNKPKKMRLITSNETELDPYLIKTEIYKKI